MDFKFNANKMVKVKLTKKGEELLKRQQKEFYNVIGEENETIDLKLDENGYYETQLWMLMKNLGPYLKPYSHKDYDLFDMNMIFIGGERGEL